MTGSIKRTTANYNLRVPIFDAPGWGREIERDLDILDATIFAATGFTNIKGVWSNSTEYHVGEYLVDQENNSLWRCRVDHTSAATGSFQDDRTANPTYWEVVNRIVNFRGEWDGDASYLTNDFLVDGYRYGVVTQNYEAGASYDADVLAGNILTLIDLTDAMGDANQAVSDAQGYANAASSSAGDAANAKIDAETAQGLAEAAKADAETAQGLAEDARDLAEGYKDSAAQSASDASDAKDAAVIAQGLAESARDDAVQAKNDAQGAASDAEGYRDETEIARNAVIGIYNNFAGGTSGQVLVKASSADFDYGWQTLSGIGDMLASVYDPQGIGDDAFDRANHTGTQPTSTIDGLDDALDKLAGIEEGADVSPVISVAGKIGEVTLDKTDVGLDNVDNTSDADKPVSTAQQAALDDKADNTITLTAGTGLTGGGNLTEDRSFAVDFGTTAGTVAEGNDARIVGAFQKSSFMNASLLPDSGRFGGINVKSTTVSSFAFPPYIVLYNDTTVASAGKFITNNSDYGGSAGSLPATVKDLIDKIKAPTHRRYGVEFFVAEMTKGAGTTGSAINISGTLYYISSFFEFGPQSPKQTLHMYLRAVDAPILLDRAAGMTIFKDGVPNEDHVLVEPSDGWVSIIIHFAFDPYEHIGYQPSIFQIRAAQNGHRYQIACPALIPGIVDLDDNIGVVASTNRYFYGFLTSASGGGTNNTVTISSGSPSGGVDGDIWLQV